jgi:hypothetical protein
MGHTLDTRLVSKIQQECGGIYTHEAAGKVSSYINSCWLANSEEIKPERREYWVDKAKVAESNLRIFLVRMRRERIGS